MMGRVKGANKWVKLINKDVNRKTTPNMSKDLCGGALSVKLVKLRLTKNGRKICSNAAKWIQ